MTTEKRQRNGVPGAVQRPRAEALYKPQSTDRARTRFITVDQVIFEVHNGSVAPSVYMTKVIHTSRSTAKPPPEPRLNLLPAVSSPNGNDDVPDASAKPLTVALLDNPHQLPDQVAADVLELVLKYCYFHTSKEKADKNSVQIRDWDDDFVRMDPRRLCELASAAYYLEVPALVELTCRAIANIISGKDPDQIRDTFQIENDLLQRFMPRDGNSSGRRGSASGRAGNRRQGHSLPFQPAKKQSSYSLAAIDDADNLESDDNAAANPEFSNLTVSELADWINSSDAAKRNGKKRKKKRNKQKASTEPDGVVTSSQIEHVPNVVHRDITPVREPATVVRSDRGTTPDTRRSAQKQASSDDEVVFVSMTPAKASSQKVGTSQNLAFIEIPNQANRVKSESTAPVVETAIPPTDPFNLDYRSMSDGSNEQGEPQSRAESESDPSWSPPPDHAQAHSEPQPNVQTRAKSRRSTVPKLRQSSATLGDEGDEVNPTRTTEKDSTTGGGRRAAETQEDIRRSSGKADGNESLPSGLHSMPQSSGGSGIETDRRPGISTSLRDLSIDGGLPNASSRVLQNAHNDNGSVHHEKSASTAPISAKTNAEHLQSSTIRRIPGNQKPRSPHQSRTQNASTSGQDQSRFIDLSEPTGIDIAHLGPDATTNGEAHIRITKPNGTEDKTNFSGRADRGARVSQGSVGTDLGRTGRPFIHCPESMNREVADFEKRLNANPPASMDRSFMPRSPGGRAVCTTTNKGGGHSLNRAESVNPLPQSPKAHPSEMGEGKSQVTGHQTKELINDDDTWKRKMEEAVLQATMTHLQDLATVYAEQMKARESEREKIREDLGQVRIASEQLSGVLPEISQLSSQDEIDLLLRKAKLVEREAVLKEMADRISKQVFALHGERDEVLDRLWQVRKKWSNMKK